MVAVIIPVNTPLAVGVPERTPAEVSVSPGGKDVDEKVGGGTPSAV